MGKHVLYTNRDSAEDWMLEEDGYGDEWLDAPDIFRLEYGFHNGPECKRCGMKLCHHCHEGWAEGECLA